MPMLFSLPVLPHRTGAARRHRTGSGRGNWRALSVCCLLLSVALYGASPLLTLWRAADGINRHDPELLRTALDWGSVRDGLKQDMGGTASLALAGASAQQQDELPAFGESFATTVVSHAIDTMVTPDTLIGQLSDQAESVQRSSSRGWSGMLGRVVSLRFTSPTRFDAAIRMRAGESAPLLVSLRLSRWQWLITRIHLPDDGSGPAIRTDRT